MRASPSIVPGIDRDVYLVLDDFGRGFCAWRESNRQVDVVSIQIVKSAGLNVIAHRRLPSRQPAAVSERLDKLLDG